MSGARYHRRTTPTGFVTLDQAVDLIGREIFGPSWRDQQEYAEHVLAWRYERVIKAIAEGCEAGRLVAAYPSNTGGIDDLPRKVWWRERWRSFFINGTVVLDLPRFAGGRPVGSGETIPCEREIFIQRDSLDRLIAALPPPVKTDSRPTMSKAEARAFARTYVREYGESATQSGFEEALRSAEKKYPRDEARILFTAALPHPPVRGRPRKENNSRK